METEEPDELENFLQSTSNQSVLSLEETINALGRSFISHPGFMWKADGFGFEVLHADWPAYPLGHGIRSTLSALAEYPRDTRFFRIDAIDQCTLFAVGEKPKQDPTGPKYLHVALWDEDLRACASARSVEGIRDEGEFIIAFPDGFMQLTPKGVNSATIDALLGSALDSLEDEILDHLHEARYDTAVREASLRVELALRRASGLSDYGRRLVDKCFGVSGVLVPNGITNPDRQRLRNLFDAYFKFVRNEFAHNLPPVDMLTACTLVRRSASLLMLIRAVERRA